MWISSVHTFKSSWARIGKILAQSSEPQCGVLGLGQFLGFSVAPACRRWRFNRSAIALRMGPGASTSYVSRMVRTVVRTHVVSLLLVLLELLLYVHSWFEHYAQHFTQFGLDYPDFDIGDFCMVKFLCRWNLTSEDFMHFCVDGIHTL